MWKEKEQCTFLWLHGRPGDGKTITASYVIKNLWRHYGYAKDWDIASIFCSRDDCETGLVASLAFQLIQKNYLRAQVAQTKIPITNFQGNRLSDKEPIRELWLLLEASIVAASAYETVVIIDRVDVLRPDIRSSFLSNLVGLEKRIQSKTIIRVLISSRPYRDIGQTLAHYSSIEKGKERKGEYPQAH
jgi:Cdc6-like AAA superfamily ATPase